MIRNEIVYFEEGGSEHTDVTLDLSLKAAKDLGINRVVVASNTGETGLKAAEKFSGKGVELIVIGHQTGFPVPGKNLFLPENKSKIESLGGIVYLGSDVLTNSIRQRQRLGPSPLSYIAQTLIAMKVKVNVEIVAKAADAGLLQPGELCISVAGSHKGADTAVVFTANDSANILDIRPLQYIAIPLSRQKADEEYMKRRQEAQTKKA
jgi:hypothetical protein